MLRALRQPAVLRLWIGQALSSIGDEIYRVGLTWIAVGMIGEDTGYLTAAQFASLMILSFVGGKWAERWEPLRTMIGVDLVRAAIVILPVIASLFVPVPLWLLVVVAVVLSALGAFFDPALQTLLPKFAKDQISLRATTGLMMTTIRLARMVGPAIVGFLAGLIPAIHFFTFNAVSFIVSAISIIPLRKHLPEHAEEKPHAHISYREAVLLGFRSVQKVPGMAFLLWAKAITASTWNLAFGLGLALMVQKLAPNDTRSFGYVIASYGIGNFIGALYFGNTQRRKPASMMFIGFIWLGLGFAWMAGSNSIPLLMVAAVFTGFSGTANEVTYFDMVQSHFQNREITRVIRLRMATDTAFTLGLYLIAPTLFRAVGAPTVVFLCGLIWIGIGTFGLIKYKRVLDPAPAP